MTTALAIKEPADLSPMTTLPMLVRRAAEGLAKAESAAEVLEAREMARLAYDAGTSALRMAKIKQAHDEVIGAVYHAQADALEIEFKAKRRLADEYDAAKERGDVAGEGQPRTAEGAGSTPSISDLGLSSQEISEGREIGRAETAQPGITRDIIDVKVTAGAPPPSRAEMRQAFREVTRPSASAVLKQERQGPPDTEDRAADAVTGACKMIIWHMEKTGGDRIAVALVSDLHRGAGITAIRQARDALNQLLGACDVE